MATRRQFLATAATSLAASLPSLADEPAKARSLNYTIGKETTYVTGPLSKDGSVDFVAACNERLGKGVKPDDNAAIPLWQAIGPKADSESAPAELFRLLGCDPPPADGNYFVEFSRFLKDRNEEQATIDALDRKYAQARERPWTAEDCPELANWLKAIDQPLGLIVAGMKRPRFFAPRVATESTKGAAGIITGPSNVTHLLRYLTQALIARAMNRCANGQSDDAWRDLWACHRLARFIARDSTLIEGLVAIAVETVTTRANLALIESGKLSSKQLLAIQSDLGELKEIPSFATVLDGAERLYSLATTLELDGRGTNFIAKTLRGEFILEKIPEGVAVRIDWNPVLRATNRSFDRFAAILRLPSRLDRDREWQKVDRESADWKKKPEATGKLDEYLEDAAHSPKERGERLAALNSGNPVARRMFESYDQVEQGRRNLQVAIALAAYRADTAEYPKDLAALVPRYLPKVPNDLFTEKALVYRPSATGYLLYSFGPNGKDDEGRTPKDTSPGDDIAIRMPLPKPEKGRRS